MLTYPTLDKNLYSNYPIIYYLSQMLKQPKPTDVIISQKSFAKELLLQILHTATHSMLFHNIEGMSSSIAVQDHRQQKVFGLTSLMWSKRSLLSCTAVCWRMGLCKEITMWWGYCKLLQFLITDRGEVHGVQIRRLRRESVKDLWPCCGLQYGSYSWSMAHVTILRMRWTALLFSLMSRGPTTSLLMDVSWTTGTTSSIPTTEKSWESANRNTHTWAASYIIYAVFCAFTNLNS